MRLSVAFAVASLVSAPVILEAQGARAEPDTTRRISVGGFVDGYYAFDFNRPVTFDRAFTTQPARHNEFNINLAFVDARLEAPRVRGRLALQAGTSVQSNYAGEPRIGSVSGPDLARLIQEAVGGTRVAGNLWIDGGIFLSHIGMEGFISRDNPMYTRSLVADYSPYYETGVKATWQATPRVSVLVAALNGWQNISETNAAKSAGVRIDYAASSTTTLSYYNYLGDEAPDSARTRQLRFYNGAGIKASVTPAFLVLAELDYGTQERAPGAARAHWYGGMLTGRWQATGAAALVGRVERYEDEDQAIIVTGVQEGFRANGGSVGIDVATGPGVVWRTELRGFAGEAGVFPRRGGGLSKRDAFVVTSLALSF